ncbi:hypothetical protein [Streptomyces sp. NPDC048361]|uniref:hypothetical protein n=1 Tax=Streptomyces sp. NPDC048361 TaxID=3154720 RepID=UPI00343D436D
MIWILVGFFPLFLMGLIAAVYAVAASFTVDKEKRSGCLLISVPLLVALLFPMLALWVDR